MRNAAAAPDAPPRERLLAAAHALFYRDGVRATGVDRVIAEAGVTKVTFYRQFPSKDDLVLAFLAQRHDAWMAWFTDALTRHGGTVAAVVPALREWLGSDDYRGCAFINTLGELGATQPAVVQAVRAHKADMAAALAALLPAGRGRARQARAMALTVDGAIVQAQVQGAPEEALASLGLLLKSLSRAEAAG